MDAVELTVEKLAREAADGTGGAAGASADGGADTFYERLLAKFE